MKLRCRDVIFYACYRCEEKLKLYSGPQVQVRDFLLENVFIDLASKKGGGRYGRTKTNNMNGMNGGGDLQMGGGVSIILVG